MSVDGGREGDERVESRKGVRKDEASQYKR